MEENNAQSVPTERVDDRYDRQMFRILRNIDLNLLTIFEAVYVHKGIVNAAKILNITPSAISQSLNKLRALFPDPLFIRKGQGVTPTAYATHLHKHISQDGGVSQRPGFNRQYAAGTGDNRCHLSGYRRVDHAGYHQKAAERLSPDFAAQRRHYRRGQPVKPASG